MDATFLTYSISIGPVRFSKMEDAKKMDSGFTLPDYDSGLHTYAYCV